jgi:cell division protein FtsL
MTEFHTVKQIDNSRLVRAAAPSRMRECIRLVLVCGAMAAVVLVYAWQHFEYIQLRAQVEELKATRTQAAELNQQLKLEVAGLRSPMRIDAIARNQLGLNIPVPGQMAPMQGPAGSELARLGGQVPTRALAADSR